MPFVVNAKAFGANDRINMGFIGMGGQGRGDMGGFMGFKAVRAVAVCDVVDDHLKLAQKQGNFRSFRGDSGGGWSSKCQMRNADGAPVQNLRFES